MAKKVCTQCTPHSEEWTLSAQLAKSNRRIFIALVLSICLSVCLIAGIVGGFIWYINQFEIVEDTVEQHTNEVDIDAQDGGDVNYIGNDGDIVNGES